MTQEDMQMAVSRNFARLDEENQAKASLAVDLGIEACEESSKVPGKPHYFTKRVKNHVEALVSEGQDLTALTDTAFVLDGQLKLLRWIQLQEDLLVDPFFRQRVLGWARRAFRTVNRHELSGSVIRSMDRSYDLLFLESGPEFDEFKRNILARLSIGRVEEAIEKCGDWFAKVKLDENDVATEKGKVIESWAEYMDCKEIQRDTKQLILDVPRTMGEANNRRVSGCDESNSNRDVQSNRTISLENVGEIHDRRQQSVIAQLISHEEDDQERLAILFEEMDKLEAVEKSVLMLIYLEGQSIACVKDSLRLKSNYQVRQFRDRARTKLLSLIQQRLDQESEGLSR